MECAGGERFRGLFLGYEALDRELVRSNHDPPKFPAASDVHFLDSFGFDEPAPARVGAENQPVAFPDKLAAGFNNASEFAHGRRVIGTKTAADHVKCWGWTSHPTSRFVGQVR